VRRGAIAALGVAAFWAVGAVPVLGVLLAMGAYVATIGLVASDKEREDSDQREREDRDTWKAAKDGLSQHGFNPEAYLDHGKETNGR